MNKFIILALLLVGIFTQGDVVVVQDSETENTGSAEVAPYEVKDSIVILTADNFVNALAEFDYVLVKFFAPWCGHCKHLVPVWTEVAKALEAGNSQARIAEVDCTIHQAVCQQNGIRGYPTLLWFQKGKEGSEKYAGQRTTEAFLTWINQKVNPTQENVGEL